MRIARSNPEIRRQLAGHRGSKSIALVPTMGCLHAGHASLIKKARSLADTVVVSIYVNPLQFGPAEDLDRYPRTFDDDARLCQKEGVDFIFHPATLYPRNGPKVTLTAHDLAGCLCGASRPGHFDGVLTVVNILLNVIQPDIAVFGEKDWQQLALIRRMVSDLQMPVEIVGAETVRETDGLALSSRNRYLSDAERRQSIRLSQALAAMQKMAADGEDDAGALKNAGLAMLAEAGIEPEYLEIRNARSLKTKWTLNRKQQSRVFIAAKVGKARLIDNMPLRLGPAAPKTEMTR